MMGTMEPRQPSDDMLAHLKGLSEQIKALPEPIAYLVLDHAMPGVDGIKERDGHGKLFVRVSPRMLDEVRHRKAESAAGGSIGLVGVPVYRREDLPEGWPYA